MFDFYGTLIDDDVTAPPMWRYLNERGYASHEELEAIFEPNAFDGWLTATTDAHDEWVHANWRAFLRLSGVPRSDETATLAGMLERRASFEVRRAAGATDLVDLLRRRGVVVGVCSNWETSIAPYMEAAGLPAFDAVVTSRDCGARKPHPSIFEHTCRELNVAPREAVFVGDCWETDVVGALRAGLRPVWIRQNRPSRGLRRGLVFEVESIAQLERRVRSGAL